MQPKNTARCQPEPQLRHVQYHVLTCRARATPAHCAAKIHLDPARATGFDRQNAKLVTLFVSLESQCEKSGTWFQTSRVKLPCAAGSLFERGRLFFQLIIIMVHSAVPALIQRRCHLVQLRHPEPSTKTTPINTSGSRALFLVQVALAWAVHHLLFLVKVPDRAARPRWCAKPWHRHVTSNRLLPAPSSPSV